MKLITATGDATQQALQTCADQWCKANHTPLRPVIMHETPVIDSTLDAIDWLTDHVGMLPAHLRAMGKSFRSRVFMLRVYHASLQLNEGWCA